MPELPEVEHVCRYLRPRLRGRRIARVTHLDWPKGLRGTTPRAFAKAVAGALIAGVERRAELVMVGLEDGRTLAFHLKMTGKLWVDEKALPPDRFTRAIFELSGGAWLRFEDQRKFGWIAVLDEAEREEIVSAYGPDALGASEADLAAAYAAHRGRAKPVLLDQSVVAGIGNIYADEILFAAGVHPARRLETLRPADFRRLARATREVMRDALARREGVDVPDQKRVGSGARGLAARLGPKVYQRTGDPCLRCETPIERIMLGGRATHLCAKCQRKPR
jgi:formamidopyrimidine-DNA glycosylase